MLRDDEWHAIAAYLAPRDLCAMMRTSHHLCELFVADGAWLTQRNRVCDRFPALSSVFDAFDTLPEERGNHASKACIKRNSNKRRKTPWLMPLKGTWYTFKRWLSKGCSFLGFRELLLDSGIYRVDESGRVKACTTTGSDHVRCSEGLTSSALLSWQTGAERVKRSA